MNSNSGAIIDPQLCVSLPIDFAFTTKPPGDKNSCHLAAVDASGNVLFRAKESRWRGVTRLQDAAGNTLLTMKAKFWTLHGKWQAFTGDSTEAKNLVFSIKRSSAVQFHNEWFVHLAANTKEKNCDFKINGSYRKKTNTIYRKDSSFVVVAQLTKEHKLNFGLEKHAFGATISENCDHSFVAALIVMLHGVDEALRRARRRVVIRAITGGVANC